MSGIAERLPTVTESFRLARRLNSVSSRRVQPLPSSRTATASRMRSMSASCAWSSTSICFTAFSTAAVAGLPSIVRVYETCGATSALRRRDAQDRRLLEQVVGPDRAVGIADAPVALRVAVVAPGDVVEAFAVEQLVPDE